MHQQAQFFIEVDYLMAFTVSYRIMIKFSKIGYLKFWLLDLWTPLIATSAR